LQAVSQQTPSTQWPVAHWFAAPQAVPGPSCATHTPAEQKAPAAQSASTLQSPRQLAGPQAKAPQDWVWSGGQEPAPSQTAARVAVPLAQVGARHWVVSVG